MAGYDHFDESIGRTADPDAYNNLGRYVDRMSKRIVGLGIRGSSSSLTTSEVGVLRIDNVPIKAGDAYRFWTSPLIFKNDTSGGIPQVTLRLNASGIATTASSQLTIAFDAVGTPAAAVNLMTKHINYFYSAVSDQNVSILLTVSRFGGTGQVQLVATGSTPIQLVAEWVGWSPGDTGVDL